MLSIIIPCFNDHQNIGRLLGVLSGALTRYDFEVVVVDDKSTESTLQDLAPWVEVYGDRLVLHQNSENQGPGPSRNQGLAQARGTDICFVDSDDYIDESFLFYYNKISRDHDFEVAIFKYHYQTSGAAPFSFLMTEIDEVLWARFERTEPADEVMALWQHPYMVMTVNYPWNKFYKREFLIEKNILFPDLRLHEDIPFHWQAMMLAEKHYFALHYPPLLVHNRLPDRGRATEGADARRLLLVDSAEYVLELLHEHPHLKMYFPIFLRFFLDVYFWAKEVIHASHRDELSKSAIACLVKYYSDERLAYIQEIDSELAGRLIEFVEAEAAQ